MADLMQQLKTPNFLLKWVELILAVVSIALLRDSGSFPGLNVDKIVVAYMTLAGFILFNCIIIVGSFNGETLGKITMLLYLLSGAVLFITTGAFIIEHYDQKLFNTTANDKFLASGIIALVNGAVYLVDGFFTRRG
ncbi:uncharacterized protein LOC124166131 [Ischnura elegans]|uniref:uncharacterized protein LOC124166131 n=1 Tax=Ischnura elegans TaxID=197161 RepID=UPI001ED86C94|nr:uncharacterized protein LOC124166131 [Ischnura elegans]XP_046399753.1 uncharacterized protein LOC124166131 [Ischnura elegans]